MFGIGMTELVIILVIALIVIGPNNLPEIARALGKGYAEFQKIFREAKDSINEDVSDISRSVKDWKGKTRDEEGSGERTKKKEEEIKKDRI